LFVIGAIVLLFPGMSAQAQGGPPPIPHSLEGRQDCVICHATGVGGAPKFPTDHTGRTNEMCQLCHNPTGGATHWRIVQFCRLRATNQSRNRRRAQDSASASKSR
jgi:hypothetical protein